MKEEILQEIVQTMQEHKLTLKDVEAFAKKHLSPQDLPALLTNTSFDVLIDHCGTQKRIAFDEWTGETVLGIFPFKDEDVLIRSWESNQTTLRKRLKEKDIPTLDLCLRIFPLLSKINEIFARLDQPKLQGRYYVHGRGHGYQNWIATFDEDAPKLKVEWFGSSEIAKFRYFTPFKD